MRHSARVRMPTVLLPMAGGWDEPIGTCALRAHWFDDSSFFEFAKNHAAGGESAIYRNRLSLRSVQTRVLHTIKIVR